MIGWFKKKPARLQPENGWATLVDVDCISVSDGAGQIKRVSKADLSGVAIETNDSGPWGADIWWLIFGGEDQLVCAFPQGATGEGAVVDFLTALPSFDHSEMIKAMTSTGNAVFPVWRRAVQQTASSGRDAGDGTRP